MRHGLLLLNILLIGLTGAAGFQLNETWLRDQKHEHDTLYSYVSGALNSPADVLHPPPVSFTGSTYPDIAQKNLFSKDRNPNIIYVQPTSVKPILQWPRMPIVRGLLGLPAGLVAFLSETADGASSVVPVGGTIGTLKVTSLSAERISFQFEGEIREMAIQDLVHRGDGVAETATMTKQNIEQPNRIPGIDLRSIATVQSLQSRE